MIAQPIGQVRLTNVAYVRLVKGGKKFEIACYRNKVINWRNKIEQDINEVLQVTSVFTNVSKGMLASVKDLQDSFGTSDPVKVCTEILEKGDLQVSEQERQAMLESTFRDVATLICDMTINPENGRQYSLSMMQDAMKQIHYSVNLAKSAKQQALEVIRKLKPVMSIARAGMQLRLVFRPQDVKAIEEMIGSESSSITVTSNTSSGGDDVWLEVRVDPEVYRRLQDSVRDITEGFGRVEILQLRAGAAGAPSVSAGDRKVDTAADQSAMVEHSKQQLGAPCKHSVPPSSSKTEEEDASNDDDDHIPRGMVASKSRKKDKRKQSKLSQHKAAEGEAPHQPAAVHSDPAGVEVALPALPPPSAVSTTEDGALVALYPEPTGLGKKCNTCGGSFESDADYRSHFRSEWHRYNLKRKMKNLPLVSLLEFSAVPASEIAKTVDS